MVLYVLVYHDAYFSMDEILHYHQEGSYVFRCVHLSVSVRTDYSKTNEDIFMKFFVFVEPN